jgi:hypothetical protein
LLLTWFLIALLGVWRITHLLVAEDGPWEAVARLREVVGSGFWGKLLDCFACLSLWVSAPFALALGTTWIEWMLLWLALSGGAMLIERLTTKKNEPPPAHYIEDLPAKEDHDDMLRK